MRDVEVIDRPDAAAALVDPLRAELLTRLREPGSASTLAAALGESRQKVNYHLRALERVGLVELVEERPRRGLTERVVQASAASYLLSPAVLAANAADPARVDRLSAGYLVALAGRVVREVSELAVAAERAERRLPTLAIDADVRFASAAERAAFTAELHAAVTELVARYHDESAPGGRWHRLVVGAHPRPGRPTAATDQEGTT